MYTDQDQLSFWNSLRLNSPNSSQTGTKVLPTDFMSGMESTWSSSPLSTSFTATNTFPHALPIGGAQQRGIPSMAASRLIAGEEPPQVASTFLEATERLLKPGSQYQKKHEDTSRRLAGNFLALGAEQRPENVQDFLNKKRQETKEALIESEESVRAQAKRREAYLTPDIEWEKFKEGAVFQFLVAGNGSVFSFLRSQKVPSLDFTGSGDRQLTKEELQFAQTLRECNDEMTSTHSAVANLPERFTATVATSTDKIVQSLWNAYSAIVTQVRSDARTMTSQEQVATFRLSEMCCRNVLSSARSYLELSAFAVAEEQTKNPVRESAESPSGSGFNVVVSYARLQLSKNRLALDATGTRLHGVPVWALVYYAVRLGALKTAVAFCGQGDQATRDFSRYLTEYQRNNKTLLAASLVELQTSYRSEIAAGAADLYKRAVMAILSCAEPEQDFGGITHSVSDWLWMKVTQTTAYSSVETTAYSSAEMTFLKLQNIVRSRFPSQQTDDVEAFFAFLLTGQFELAVERLFSNVKYRVHAVCMAFGLKQAKLLLVSYDPPTANVVTPGRNGLSCLDFASVVRIYVEGFRKKHLDQALDFYFHLTDTPAVRATTYDHQFENLFEFLVYKLAKDTGRYGELFGVSQQIDGQIARKGLVSRLMPDASRVVAAVARDLVENGELVEGLALFETGKEMKALFRTLLKVLAEDVVFPSTALHRQELQRLATGYAERYQMTGKDDDVVIRNVYVMLDLITFLGLVDRQEYRQALVAMKNINLIPLEQNAVATALAIHHNDLLPEVRECIPYVTLQSMHALINCYMTEKERILGSRLGAEVGSPLRTASLSVVYGARLSDGLVKLQAVYRKQTRAVLEFASKIPSPQLPNLMDLLIKLETSLV